MKRRDFIHSTTSAAALFALSSTLPMSCSKTQQIKQHPNIILIYTDDLGYGDVSCYGATRVKTPHIDQLAKEGLKFTEAYATAATCTPSRYALLTGEYPWRKDGIKIAPGDASLMINTDKTTIPSLLKKAGYISAVVGKWHLGLGNAKPDWNKAIKPGPLEIGFDYSFLIPATGDRVPCVYVENHHISNLDPADPVRVSFDKKIGNEPTGRSHPEQLKMRADDQHSDTIINGISRIGYMTGGKKARWKDEDMADVLTEKSTEFIEKNKNNPFFLYFSLHDIHVPRVPHPRFAGKTPMGPRGDVIIQADWCVGEILKKLDDLELSENTIVIFSSDNGPVLDDGYSDQAVEKNGDHQMTGPLRGGKYSSFEGGTRIPFLVRWPQKIEPGISHAIFSQIDLLASFAALTGQSLQENESKDSINNLAALTGKGQSERIHLVQEAVGGNLSLRSRNWKYIVPSKGPKVDPVKNIETGNNLQDQLYDLSSDIGETHNLAKQYPHILTEMKSLLKEVKEKGDRQIHQET